MKIIGRHAESFASETTTHITITTVLTEGAVGGRGNYDFAAYQAHSTDPDWVAAHGSKLTYRDAAKIFPNLKPEDYRR